MNADKRTDLSVSEAAISHRVNNTPIEIGRECYRKSRRSTQMNADKARIAQLETSSSSEAAPVIGSTAHQSSSVGNQCDSTPNQFVTKQACTGVLLIKTSKAMMHGEQLWAPERSVLLSVFIRVPLRLLFGITVPG
jgi:hypothetical protein